MAAGTVGEFRSRTRRLQMSGLVGNKNRRLTSSASSSNIPQQNVLATQNGYNTLNQAVDAINPLKMGMDTQTPNCNAIALNLGADQNGSKTPSSELAKIQATSALTIDPALLVQQCDTQPHTELVTKFVDFSSKYGLGYMLSNGSYGVLFNDSTKIVLHANLFHFDYIERSKQQPLVNSNG